MKRKKNSDIKKFISSTTYVAADHSSEEGSSYTGSYPSYDFDDKQPSIVTTVPANGLKFTNAFDLAKKVSKDIKKLQSTLENGGTKFDYFKLWR